ncbi:hypothetical protein P9654_09890 [Bacillus atrophaeus]|uniref:hypothetical protein n=1 Tax=Bacillus atrophaeus TaxID=1452 RepID=UPI002E220B94|nr:hypothetical protein [Bacillus atrophaeus]
MSKRYICMIGNMYVMEYVPTGHSFIITCSENKRDAEIFEEVPAALKIDFKAKILEDDGE